MVTDTDNDTDNDNDTDTWFIVKATDPYTRTIPFSTTFDDLIDDVHCSATLLSYTVIIHHIHTV